MQIAAHLPLLRQDIRLSRINAENGQSRFLVHDPLAHRYFALSKRSVEIISFWPRVPQSTEWLSAAMNAAGRQPPSDEELSALLQFMRSAHMVVARGNSFTALKAQMAKQNTFNKAIIGAMFFKLPIVRPAHFIRWVYPFFALLFTRTFTVLSCIAMILALTMAIRQPQAIVEQAMTLATLAGGVAFFLTLAFIKVVHEFGHAFQAYRNGAQVPRMGIMFLLGLPLPYTELSDVWTLRRRRSRLYVDFGGILAELALASWAALAFFFLPDGPIKSLAYLMAVGSLLMSMLININPLMRFDGYYILADWVRIPNLQPRAANLAKWKMREVLFNLGHPPPEIWSPQKTRRLIAFGVAVYVYRLLLYFGIAIMAYAMAFKLLGIFLFIFEIYFFILRPIWLELKQLWKMKGQVMRSPRTYFTLIVFAALIGSFFYPYTQTISIPARASVQGTVDYFAPSAARLKFQLAEGSKVQPGDVIFRLENAELDLRLEKLRAEKEQIEFSLSRVASDTQARSDTAIAQEMLISKQSEIDAILEKQKELQILASVPAVIKDLTYSEKSIGHMVQQNQFLGRAVPSGDWSVKGYVSDKNIVKLSNLQEAAFVPTEPTVNKVAIDIQNIDPMPIENIEHFELVTQFGGAIETQPDAPNKPIGNWFRIHAIATETLNANGVIVGNILFQDTPKSLASRAFVQIISIIRRETGINVTKFSPDQFRVK